MTARAARRAWAAARRKHLRPGTVHQLQFRHDPDCLFYGPTRVCNCDPDRVILDLDGKVLAEVRGAGPYSPAELIAQVTA